MRRRRELNNKLLPSSTGPNNEAPNEDPPVAQNASIENPLIAYNNVARAPIPSPQPVAQNASIENTLIAHNNVAARVVPVPSPQPAPYHGAWAPIMQQ